MNSAHEIPVLVGVGQILQRLDDPRKAVEPLEMMVTALVQAGEDCGAPKLLQRADSIYVIRGAWGYGDAGRIVAGASAVEALGRHCGAGLYEREAEYLVAHEWARTAEDILWRRTKLGLRFTPEETADLESWLAAHTAAQG